MKNLIQYIGIFLLGFALVSCNDDDPVEYDGPTNVERPDPVLIVYTPVVSFVAGEEDYPISFAADQGAAFEVTTITAYKSFTDSKSGTTSDEVVHATYDMSGASSMVYEDRYDFAGLRDGITIDGNPLPDDELEIGIGSQWNVRYEMEDSGGNVVPSRGGSTRLTVAVLSPFAGDYLVIDSDYYRIGVQSDVADWTGETRFIGSVDENTFAHIDGFGPFNPSYGPAVGQFVFDLNDDNTITIPNDPSQAFFSGDWFLTCEDNPGDMTNVPCGDDTNLLIPSADGRHIIRLSYGYYTDSGDENAGPREFYEVLQKIVE